MSSDGFDTSMIDDFVKDMMSLANDKMPKESKKFIKKEANKLNRKNKSVYRSKGIGEVTGNLIKGFKSGKVYKFNGSWSARALNNSPHAHLINDGWMHKASNGNENFIPGFHFLEEAAKAFESGYYKDCEEFVTDVINKGL